MTEIVFKEKRRQKRANALVVKFLPQCNAATEALEWLAKQRNQRTIVVTDSVVAVACNGIERSYSVEIVLQPSRDFKSVVERIRVICGGI